MEIKPTSYKLENCATKRQFQDETGWMLADPQHKDPALVRAVYEKKQIEFKDNSYGIYKFADWMPIQRMLEGSCAPVTYKSEALAKELGLENLYITFSGWWPEKGAQMPTCSFKETEAYSVCARLPKDNNRIMVVASAGNTARAFAQVCSKNNIPVVIAIPQDNLNALWFQEPLNDCVKIICSPAGTDYFDAIALAAKLNGSARYMEEGGAKNVARRDGMATTVLSAAQVIGRIPDSYFQAVGSGTGTIAAYESNLRLLEDGRFGSHLMKLIPSQNIPFTPMYDAFKADSRALLPFDEDEARVKALEIDAKVLSNRKPPYGIVGGLYDVLKATDGDMLLATNQELAAACELFEKLEGCDIHPAAGVALHSLMTAVKEGIVKKDETIMLNITGGGEKRFKASHNWVNVEPHLVMDASTPAEEVIAAVDKLF
ncbi:MAG: cysteate synthase [Bacteroidales bacterium]|nr:cysteate synthase [Bacteroidales bacterium]